MTDKPTIPMPTVHLGGTSHKMLTEGYEEAHYTLGLFIKSFCSIEFNGRDYYQQGQDALITAVDARIEINKKISDILKYLEAHLESLAEQAPKN